MVGLALDSSSDTEDVLCADDKTLPEGDRARLVTLYTDLFVHFATLILGVYKSVVVVLEHISCSGLHILIK